MTRLFQLIMHCGNNQFDESGTLSNVKGLCIMLGEMKLSLW